MRILPISALRGRYIVARRISILSAISFLSNVRLVVNFDVGYPESQLQLTSYCYNATVEAQLHGQDSGLRRQGCIMPGLFAAGL